MARIINGVASALPLVLGACLVVAQPTVRRAPAAADVARSTGQRVELVSHRTATTSVYVDPSGAFTVEVHAKPVRVKRPDGSWIPIDTTLRRKASGVISPVASPIALRLSGGGDGPLVTVVRNGKSLSFTWPNRLPAPTLDGPVATYPDVLPGVDLKIKALEDGFAKALVVKTRQAARNSALAKVEFLTGTAGVTLRPGAGGSFAAVDAGGNEVFGSGTPTMWDSSGSFDGGEEDRLTGPAFGARRSVLSMSLAAGKLSLSTDAAMLTDPKTVFPVYIDPSVSVDLNYWTMINKTLPTQSYWSYDRSDGAKTGYVYDSYQGRYHTYRSLFRFPTSSFRGKHVLSAQFSATLYHSYLCTKTRTDLYQVVTGFSSATNWDSSTPWGDHYLANASGSSCSSQGDVRMEWGSTALTNVADAVTGDWLVLGLKGYDESVANTYWKKFKPSTAKLSLNVNTPPAVPSQVTIHGHACVQGDSRPIVNSTSPRLGAYLADADQDLIDVRFLWAPLGGTTSDADSIVVADNVSGSFATVPEGRIPAGELVHGGTYYVVARAHDGIDGSGNSSQCEFTVDTSRPQTTPSVTPTPGEETLGVGQARTFTLGPNGSTDVVEYEYWLLDQAPRRVTAATDGTATVKVTPHARGLTFLYARSFTRSGIPGDTLSDYTFDVAAAVGPQAHWTMSEESGTSLVDSSGNGNDATLYGGSSRTAGRVGIGQDRAVGFDGGTGYAATPNTTVDTGKSFAVAAWVRLTDNGSSRNAVGIGTYGFFLHYDKDWDRWAFAIGATRTDDGSGGPSARSAGPPRLGVWTHLAGTFDEATGETRLYVNGRLEGTAVNSSPWTASGSTVIGRVNYRFSTGEYFHGDIDDVRLWRRLAFPDEITGIVRQHTLVGQWLFEDDPSGTTAADTSGYGHAAARSGAIAFGPGHDSTQGLEATGGHAATGGPVLLTDQGFTVAAWVRITDMTTYRTALSQAGTRSSPFQLAYLYSNNKWSLTGNPTDTDTIAPTHALSATTPTSEWTHLTGVYDPTAGQLRIYVNGALEGSAAYSAAWNATGGFYVGAGLVAGGLGGAWRGGIDEVHVFAGVLSDTLIADLPSY